MSFDTGDGKSFNYIVNGKAQRNLLVVLQDGLQSYNGWDAAAIKCAVFGGNFTTMNKLLNIKAALYIIDSASPLPRSSRSCDHPLGGGIYKNYNPPGYHAHLLLILAVVVILCVLVCGGCCCCVVSRCRSSKTYPANCVVTSVHSYSPQDAVPDLASANEAGYSCVYSFPVMITPPDGVRYALVPVTESAV